ALGDFRLGDERPGAAPAHEVALAHELVERRADGEAGDAEVDAELTLGRDRVADAQRLDQRQDAPARLAPLRHRAARTGAGASSKLSGRMPTTTRSSGARSTGRLYWPKRSAPPSTDASTRFIAGEPMKAAMKRLRGRA